MRNRESRSLRHKKEICVYQILSKTYKYKEKKELTMPPHRISYIKETRNVLLLLIFKKRKTSYSMEKNSPILHNNSRKSLNVIKNILFIIIHTGSRTRNLPQLLTLYFCSLVTSLYLTFFVCKIGIK